MAQIFVAVLGASSLIFARASWIQTLLDWIDAFVAALSVIGGVPQLIMPDNAKTPIVKSILNNKLDRDIEQLELLIGDMAESDAEQRAKREALERGPSSSTPNKKQSVRFPLPDHYPIEMIVHVAPCVCPMCAPQHCELHFQLEQWCFGVNFRRDRCRETQQFGRNFRQIISDARLDFSYHETCIGAVRECLLSAGKPDSRALLAQLPTASGSLPSARPAAPP